MIRVTMFALCLLTSLQTMAHAAVDRRVLTESAYRIFPILLQVVSKSAAFDRLSKEEHEVYLKILELKTANNPLVFDSNPEHFDLNAGESRRWMRTVVGAESQIDVNLELLNSPNVEVTLPLLLKCFFHEWSHKIGEPDWALRDKVAQFFENQVRQFVRTFALDDRSNLILLSVPLRSVNREVEKVSINRPQPTNLILLERDGHFVDLTESTMLALQKPASVIRSLWAEANRAIYEVYHQMAGLMKTALDPFMQVFNGLAQSFGAKTMDPADMANAFGVDVKEIRLLELQDVETLASDQELFVRIKSTHFTSRTERNQMPINVSGFDFNDTFAVPLSLFLRIPKHSVRSLGPENVLVSLRADQDLDSRAKVQTVHRDSDGFVQRLSVMLNSEIAPRRVFLNAVYDQGNRMLEAMEIQPVGDKRWLVKFDIPWSILRKDRSLVGESLILNTHRSVFLDRLIQLDSGESLPEAGSEANQIVPGTLGFWGLQNGEKAFFTDFKFQEPMMLVNNLNSKHKSLNPSALQLEFELEREEKVREIRFQFKRMSATLDTKQSEEDVNSGREPFQVAELLWDGEVVRIANGGTMVKKQDTNEIVNVEAEQIFAAYTRRGTQRVQASMSVPFLKAAELTSTTQAHYPPIAHPVLVEIVLDSGQILRQYFGELLPEDFCEMHLVKK